MGGSDIFDLEKHFAFYGAFHRNKINILVHVCFVWPILFTAFVLLAYTNPLVPQLPVMAGLPYHEYVVFNWSFVAAAAYALFYIVLEPKSGSLGALLVLLCCMGANVVAQQIPYASGWKVGFATFCCLSRCSAFKIVSDCNTVLKTCVHGECADRSNFAGSVLVIPIHWPRCI